MNRFYPDIASLDAFTLSLDCLDESLPCQHCKKHGHLVSHGFVYKHLSSVKKQPVGKRILCSNRYGRSGCGKTIQLYLAHRFPFFRYGAATLTVFLSLLILGLSVNAAYKAATKQQGSRHGWRWIKRLKRRLSDFRSVLTLPDKPYPALFSYRSRIRQLLLPTLYALISKWGHNLCSHFQIQAQLNFI